MLNRLQKIPVLFLLFFSVLFSDSVNRGIAPCFAQSEPSQQSASQALPKANFFEMRRVKQAKVIDVISPLTLLLSDGSIVQLSGIGIPGATALMAETSYSEGAETQDMNPLALTAMDILKDLLKRQRVNIYQTRSQSKGLVNRMGYTLAHVERVDSQVWVQGVLLSLGLAYVKTSAYNPDMAADMLALEKTARQNGVGIWRQDESEVSSIFSVLSPFEAKNAIGRFALVEGTIHSVALKQNRTYINFGADWRRDFTVSIAPEHKRNFSDFGLDPQQWGGKTIRVRGYIRQYNGAYMEITHPEAVEFIQPSKTAE